MENNQNNYRNRNSQSEANSPYENATYGRNQSEQYGRQYQNAGNSYSDRQQQSYGAQNVGYGTSENRDSRAGNMNNNMYGSRNNDRYNSGYDNDRYNQSSYSESSYSRPSGYQDNNYRNSGYRQDEYQSGSDNSYNRGGSSQGMGMGNDYDRNSNYNRTNQNNQRFTSYDNDRYGSRNENNDRGFWDKASDEVSSWFGDNSASRRRQMDERRDEVSNKYGRSYAGEHRGKGPKSYKRSDDRIQEDVNDRLSDDAHIDASHVEVAVSSGEITLSGYVANRFSKRHAEDLAEAVSGVSHVENRIRVQDSNDIMTVADQDAKDAKAGTTQNASAVNTNSSGKSKQVS